MLDSVSVAVSPKHAVQLAAGYMPLLDRAPQADYVVRTIERRQVDGLALMSAEIVIASAATRERHPLAATYPLHFRKTYFPASLHVAPKLELERTREAGTLIRVPLPIGFEPHVYRSCFVPGTPYARLTPFAFEPEESNLPRAAKLPLATAVGLWHLAEDAFSELTRLHEGGLTHGDLELQNIVACPSPLEVILVDFEGTTPIAQIPENERRSRLAADRRALLREAVLLQVALGRQPGPLGDLAWEHLPELFRDADRFRRAIELRPPAEDRQH